MKFGVIKPPPDRIRFPFGDRKSPSRFHIIRLLFLLVMTPHLARNVFRPDPKKYILVQYLSIMRLHPSLSLMLPIIPVKNGAHAMDWLSFFARLYPSRCQCYLRSWSPRSWTTMECRTSTACLRQQMSLLQLPQPIVLRTATGSGRKGGDF